MAWFTWLPSVPAREPRSPAGTRRSRRTLPGPPDPEPSLPAPLDRNDALRILELPPAADARAVKRAYRRLARTHHPDVGGEVATFHALQQAYEVLIGDDGDGVPVQPPGRPSRPRAAWSSDQTGPAREAVDLTSVRWDLPVPASPEPLSRELIARWLASGHVDPVRPLKAISRAPGARLNRAAPKLSPDLTATLVVGPATDDRGRVVVAVRVVAANRRARRVLDSVGLDGGWIRRRGTSSTTLRRTITPDTERSVTALRTTDLIVDLLDRAAWALEGWTLALDEAPPAA
ncbi:J domain-containing protein [Nitriliruptor alkaliphilus]|uniref:J domain-containing protein n=1 Tax=Nitriliruptor alkaliphilus TaxID=427918 RepID=UPI001B807D67|nr:J domain-containing protein [Nitriliruptor alkaliphilus]